MPSEAASHLTFLLINHGCQSRTIVKRGAGLVALVGQGLKPWPAWDLVARTQGAYWIIAREEELTHAWQVYLQQRTIVSHVDSKSRCQVWGVSRDLASLPSPIVSRQKTSRAVPRDAEARTGGQPRNCRAVLVTSRHDWDT